MMNQKEFAKAVAEKLDITQKDGEEIVSVVLSVLEESIKAVGEVKFMGFGNFVVKTQKARVARNPATGESVDVPAKKVLKFKVGKNLKESVNS